MQTRRFLCQCWEWDGRHIGVPYQHYSCLRHSAGFLVEAYQVSQLTKITDIHKGINPAGAIIHQYIDE